MRRQNMRENKAAKPKAGIGDRLLAAWKRLRIALTVTLITVPPVIIKISCYSS